MSTMIPKRQKPVKTSKKARKRALRKKIGLCILTLVIAALLTGGGFVIGRYMEAGSRTVELGLRDIGELSTQAAYFTNVQTITKARELLGIEIPFTDSKYVFSYDGVIKAGYDFTRIEVKTDNTAKTVTVYMPEAEIFSVEVFEDTLNVYNESESIYTPLRLGDMSAAREKLKAEAQEKAVSNGLLVGARENAESIITRLVMNALDNNTSYTVRFFYAEAEQEAE